MEKIDLQIEKHDISIYGTSETVNSQALLYHENSKLNQFSMRALGKRIGMFSNAYVAKRAMQPFKIYPGVENIPLECNGLASQTQGMDLARILVGRRSVRRYDSGYEMSVRELSILLYYAYGVNTWGEAEVQGERVAVGRRCVPSAGGLYPLELYIATLHCDLKPGLYHYQSRDNTLEHLRAGDFKQDLLRMIQAEPYVDLSNGSVVLFITGVIERQMIKYGERGYRFMQNEVGSVTQMVTLLAEVLGLGSCILGGYDDDALNDMLRVDGVFESVQTVMVIGKRRSDG